PDGRTVASGSYDRTVRLWEAATGKEVRRFPGHAEYVKAVAFSPDGTALASGGLDAAILLWDVTGRRAGRGPTPAPALNALWEDLAGADAARAPRAVWELAARPGDALPLLQAPP